MKLKNKKILIAEDERPIANALKLKLTFEGYDVEIAYNGVEALKAIDSKQYDLLLLDLIMPIKDGFDVLTELKAKTSSLPVIIASNLGQPEDIRKAKELGAIDFIIKSDTPLANIVSLINNILQK